jgi:membrane associated rhomboid family serine protease
MSDPVRARRTLPHGIAAAALVLGLCCAHAWLASRGSPSDPALLVASGAAERGRVWHGQVWRFLTGSFLEPDLGQLALVGLGLLLAGRVAERMLGVGRFLLVHASGAVGGAALRLLFLDGIGVGALPGLFGVVAGLLVAYHRERGGLRGILGTRLTWLTLALLAESTVPALLPGRVTWGGFLPSDPLAHLGGFLCGGLVAAATAAPRRAWLALVAGATLSALVAVASWPRPGPTAFEGEELKATVHRALREGDVAGARRLLDEGEQRGLRSDGLTLYRALVLARQGDLEGSLVLLRPLAERTGGPLRAEVLRQIAGIAHVLAYRYHEGQGRPRNTELGLSYLAEACRAGSAEACAEARAAEGLPAGAP